MSSYERTREDERETERLKGKMFKHCGEVLEEVASFANYGAPRFITILRMSFKRGNEDIDTDQKFTICFHLISSCPGLKFIIRKALFKAVRYNSVTMSIKQYHYPHRDCFPADCLSDLELKQYMDKKCSFCSCNGLLGPFHDLQWRDERSYLNSSMLFTISETLNVESRILYHNSPNAHCFAITKFNPLLP